MATRRNALTYFIPTHSSWLNLVERWFGLLTERQIKRGAHTSVVQQDLGKTKALARRGGTRERETPAFRGSQKKFTFENFLIDAFEGTRRTKSESAPRVLHEPLLLALWRENFSILKNISSRLSIDAW